MSDKKLTPEMLEKLNANSLLMQKDGRSKEEIQAMGKAFFNRFAVEDVAKTDAVVEDATIPADMVSASEGGSLESFVNYGELTKEDTKRKSDLIESGEPFQSKKEKPDEGSSSESPNRITEFNNSVTSDVNTLKSNNLKISKLEGILHDNAKAIKNDPSLNSNKEFIKNYNKNFEEYKVLFNENKSVSQRFGGDFNSYMRQGYDSLKSSIPALKDLNFTTKEGFNKIQSDIDSLNAQIELDQPSGEPNPLTLSSSSLSVSMPYIEGLEKTKSEKYNLENLSLELKKQNDDILAFEQGYQYFKGGEEVTKSTMFAFLTSNEYEKLINEDPSKAKEIVEIKNDTALKMVLLGQETAAKTSEYDRSLNSAKSGFFNVFKKAPMSGAASIMNYFIDAENMPKALEVVFGTSGTSPTVAVAKKAYDDAKKQSKETGQDIDDLFTTNYDTQLKMIAEDIRGQQLYKTQDIIDLYDEGDYTGFINGAAKLSLESSSYLAAAMIPTIGTSIIANSVAINNYYDLRRDGVSSGRAKVASATNAVVAIADNIIFRGMVSDALSNVSSVVKNAKKIRNLTVSKEIERQIGKTVVKTLAKEPSTEFVQGTTESIVNQWATGEPIDFDLANRQGAIEAAAAGPTTAVFSTIPGARYIALKRKEFKNIQDISKRIDVLLNLDGSQISSEDRKQQLKFLVDDYINIFETSETLATKSTKDEGSFLAALTAQEAILEKMINGRNISDLQKKSLESRLEGISNDKNKMLDLIDQRPISENPAFVADDQAVVFDGEIPVELKDVNPQSTKNVLKDGKLVERKVFLGGDLIEAGIAKNLENKTEGDPAIENELNELSKFEESEQGAKTEAETTEQPATDVPSDGQNNGKKVGEVDNEISDYIAESASRMSVEIKVGELETKIDNAEYINEDDILEAQDKLIGELDRVENSDYSENAKETIISELNELYNKLDNYEFRTETKTKEYSQKRATRNPIENKREQGKSPQERIKGIEIEVSEGDEKTVIEESDGGLVVQSFDDKGNRTEAVKLDAKTMDDFELSKTVKDNNGVVVGAVLQNKNNNNETFTISDQDIAYDLAIDKTKAELGKVTIEEQVVATEQVQQKKGIPETKTQETSVKEKTDGVTAEVQEEVDAMEADENLDMSGFDNARFSVAEEGGELLVLSESTDVEAIADDMVELLPDQVDYTAPQGNQVNVDPMEESNSSEEFTDEDAKKLGFESKEEMTKPIEYFNGMPMVFGVSDVLAGGTIKDAIGKAMKVAGGLMFNALSKFKAAWAGVKLSKSQEQVNAAVKVYKDNKELFERLWEEGKIPYGHVPMAITRMGDDAVHSNEAVFRYLAPEVKSQPIENQTDALNDIVAALEKSETPQKKKILAFIKKEKVSTFGELLDAVISDANKRAKAKSKADLESTLTLDIRTLFFSLITTDSKKEPQSGFLNSLYKGSENNNYSLFIPGNIRKAIAEPSMLKSKKGDIVSIVGVDVLNPGVVDIDHPNYGTGPRGRLIALISNPVNGTNIFPTWRAKSSRVNKPTTKGKIPDAAKILKETMGTAPSDVAFRGDSPVANMTDLDILIGKLKFAFPGVAVINTKQEFEKALSEPGVRTKITKGKVILGMTKDGKVFLNPELASLNTPIHEFGHIWIDYLRSKLSGDKGTALLQRGLKLVEGTKELKAAIKKYGDNKLAREEALVDMMANKGETLIGAAKSRFKEWMNAVFKYIQSKLVLSEDLFQTENIKALNAERKELKDKKVLTKKDKARADKIGSEIEKIESSVFKDIKKLSIDEFLNTGLADLFKGKPVNSRFDAAKESKGVKPRFELSDNIDNFINQARGLKYSEAAIEAILKKKGVDSSIIASALSDKSKQEVKKIKEKATSVASDSRGVVDTGTKKVDTTKPKKQTEPKGKSKEKTIVKKRAYDGAIREDVRIELEKLGLNRTELKTQKEVSEAAEAFIEKWGDELALEAIKKGDVRGAVAFSILPKLIKRLQNKADRLKSTDVNKLKELAKKEAEISNLLGEEAYIGGSANAQLAYEYQTLDLGWNVESKINEFKKENGGKIPENVEKRFRDLDVELKEIRKKTNEAEEREIEQEEKDLLQNIIDAADRAELPKQKKTYINNAVNSIKELRRSIKANNYSDATGIVAIIDGGLLAIQKSLEAGVEVSEAIEKGITYIKAKLKSKGVDKWEKESEFRRDVNSHLSKGNVEAGSVTVNEDGDIDIPLALLKDLIIAGNKDIESLSKAVLDILKEDNPNVTLREVRDTITGYGKTRNINKDEISKQLSKMRRMGRLISGLEDVANKKRPLRTGLQREKILSDERAKKKELREAMKGLPIDLEANEKQLKTLLESEKQRLRNKIEDLQSEIDKGKLVPRSSKARKSDAELNNLKEKRDAVKLEHDNIFKDEEFKNKKRLEITKRNLKNAIADRKRRLKTGDFSKNKRKPLIVDSELTRLKRQALRVQEEYDKEFYKYKLLRRKFWTKTSDIVLDAWGLTRALRATGEFSFILIQGGLQTISHPRYAAKAFKRSMKFLASEKKTEDWLRTIKAQIWYPELYASGLGLTDLHAEVSAREELFFSDWITTVWDFLMRPTKLFGDSAYKKAQEFSPFKMVERAAVGYLDTVRVLRYLDGKQMLEEQGTYFEDNPQAYKEMADVINTFTGRGSIGVFEKHSKILTQIFFSPRNWASVIKTATPYAFYHFGKMRAGAKGKYKPSVAQKMALSDFSKYVGVTASIVAMFAIALNGDDDEETGVELDPRSSDFGKIKIGNVRFDPWGGRIQQVVFIARFYDGHVKKNGELIPLGTKDKAPSRLELTQQQALNKLAPSAAIAAKWLATTPKTPKELRENTADKNGDRKTPWGEDYSLSGDILKNLYPIYAETINELIKDEGSSGALDGIGTFFGLFGGGVNVYDSKKKKKKKKKENTGRNASDLNRRNATDLNKRNATDLNKRNATDGINRRNAK